MFPRIFLLTLIFGWFSIHALSPVPSIYHKATIALKHYKSNPLHNPIIHSLLNILIHDKQAKAFISNPAIEMALENVKELDEITKTNDEKLLRQVIYDIYCKRNGYNCLTPNEQNINGLTPDVKHRIASALDQFFDISDAEDD